MLSGPRPEVHSALQLIRRGRFAETVATLKQFSQALAPPRKKDFLAEVLLADALQRIGQNQDAETIAYRNLPRVSAVPPLCARYHLVLGNVLRERGRLAKAVEHFQIAATNADSDHELFCWTQLRLMAAIGELSGREAAIARLDSVTRALTRFGDSRPFAALHLWLVQTDAMRGDLNSARRHLETAESLLSNIDDVWLRGYLAINSSAVHYYFAEIDQARRWAEKAILNARESGHRTTTRAAYANLGYFEFAVGELALAEQYFVTALECCESGSANEIAILDNIAETQLERGDLDGCRRVLAQLDALARQDTDANRRHYNAWALQTKVRLMLREGRNTEARQIANSIRPLVDGLPQARITTESQLLAAEAFIDDELAIAADNLAPILSSTVQLSPDLFAEAELVTGKVLKAFGAPQLARIHLERAVNTFETIGHVLGKQRSVDELGTLLPFASQLNDDIGPERSLDRFRALLDLRARPELFGCEAVSLLQELKCSSAIQLIVGHGSERRIIRAFSASRATTDATAETVVAVGPDRVRPVTLSFVPLEDSKSKLISLSFKRVIEQLLALRSTESTPGQEIMWASNVGAPVTRGVVFASDAMLAVLRTVKRIAPADVSVLITGETGAGKEVVARAIHEHSHRSAMPFLALNCAAVPKDLLETQLFGHKKGAFSGAAEAYPGIVRAANGGTLFLDEIGEIPIEVQAKLLRFLEMSEVHPVGETHPIKVDVRLVFATNGNLEEAVAQNRFRQDLFYRLNVIPIKVPPLRERREEIPVLANFFAQRFGAEFSKDPVRFSSDAMELLILYAWPGNIRQLANEVRRVTALSESGALITPDYLSPHLHVQRAQSGVDAAQAVPQMHVRIDQSLERATAHLESEMIKHALRQAGGRVSAAASMLGISRKGLYLKRLRLGLVDFNGRAS